MRSKCPADACPERGITNWYLESGSIYRAVTDPAQPGLEVAVDPFLLFFVNMAPPRHNDRMDIDSDSDISIDFEHTSKGKGKAKGKGKRKADKGKAKAKDTVRTHFS